MVGNAKWYDDATLVAELPMRYRAYAAYTRLMGNGGSRRVPGGSFGLRAISRVSSALRLPTTAKVRGIDGLTVVTDFADERVLDVIYEIRGENPEYAVMRGLLSTGDTFIDIGANFGTFSLLASRLVGARGRVIAIEPQPVLAASINESMKLSRCGNCEVFQVACGNAQSHLELLVPAGDSGRAGFFENFSGRARHDAVRVSVSSLDILLTNASLPGRMLIKVDVEGSETAVLDGARHLIAAHRPAIIVELNRWSAAAAGKSPRDVLDTLDQLGYTSFATMESYPSTVPRSAISTDAQSNVVALS